MFTIRLIDKNTDTERTEYNVLCERYQKNREEGTLECFGIKGYKDTNFMEFDIDGHPYTNAYIMNPAGKTIDKMACLVNVHTDDDGNVVGTIPEKEYDDE